MKEKSSEVETNQREVFTQQNITIEPEGRTFYSYSEAHGPLFIEGYDRSGRKIITTKSGDRVIMGCFITTACCEYKGLPDDCHELQNLSSLRDRYILQHPIGGPLVKLYYDTAPLIVAKLNDKDLRELYSSAIEPSSDLVDQEKYFQAFNIYLKMMRRLYDRYLPERIPQAAKILNNPQLPATK